MGRKSFTIWIVGTWGLLDRWPVAKSIGQSLRFGEMRVIAYTDIHEYAPRITLSSTVTVCFQKYLAICMLLP